VVIEGGAPYTRTATVGLSLSAQDLPATPGAAVSGLSKMELADNLLFTGSVLLDYNLAYTWTASSGQGLKAVYARFHDRAGNVSAPAVALITLDTVAPQSPSLLLSGGPGAPAGTTGSPLVTATLSATDVNGGPGGQDLQVRLSNASGFAGASWQPFSASVTWLLPPGDGSKTVFAQFMDPAGNQSLAAQADIVLAGTAPSAGSLTVAGGAAATGLQVVPVALSAAGAAQMQLYVNGVAATGWIPYATSATVDLGATPDEATRVVAVSFRNQAGVTGAGASTSIVFDQRAPTAPSLLVNGGAAFTGSATVTLALSATDAPAAAGGFASGLDTVELADNALFTAATVLPYADTAPWTLTGLDGSKVVWARFRDRAGNRSEAVSATIVLDTLAPASPTTTLTGSAGAQAGATGTAAVVANLSATDLNEGAGKANLQVRLASDAGFTGAAWQPWAPTIAWTLTAGDGPKLVYAQFRDAAGNQSLAVSAGITLAATPPSGGSIILAGGAAATNQVSVSAAVSAAGASQMLFYVNGVPQAGGWVAYATSGTVNLGVTPDEAVRTVAVAFRNAGGVEGGGASAAIVLDQQAPTAPAVTINGGAAFAGGVGVTLTLSASDGPVAGATASGLASVEVANNAAFTGLSSFAYTDTLSWTLAAGADGPRTVYVRFKDRAGNLSTAASATLLLDTTGPGSPSIALTGNPEAQSGYTGTAVVTATLSANDANQGATKQNLQVRLSNDSGFAGASWQPYATGLPWVLPVGDGLKTVYAQFKDAVGNQSLVASTTITLDATPPTGGAIAVAGGAAATNQASVTATISAVGAAQMQLYVNGVAQPGGWAAYAGSTSVSLGTTPDETTRTVSAVFRNFGGVEGGAAITSILMDRTAPVSPSVLINADAALAGDYPVTLTLTASDGPVSGTTASGLDTVEISNAASFTPSSTFPFSGSVPWTLSLGADGPRTVYARFKDKAGNVSTVASDTIVLDRTAPTPGAFTLAGNAEAQAGYTGTAVVTASLSATDANEGAGKINLQVRLGNDPTFAGSSWQSYVASLPWVLPLGDGPKNVYAQFRDSSGNVSAPTSASIQLLTAPPTGGTIAVAGGAPATNQASVTATIGAVGAVKMQLYVNGAAQPGGWVAYATSAAVALGLTPDESTRTVSAVFRSAGGVDGGDAVTSIVMDHTAPVAPTLVINGGATFSGSTGVTLSVSAQDGPQTGTVASGLASVEVADNVAFTALQAFPYAAALPWTVSAGDGAKAVYARFRDKAGNTSSAVTSAITLDRTAPSGVTIALAGNAEAPANNTGTPVVTASVFATDAYEGIGKANLQVRLGNDSGFSGSSWQPYTTSLPWVLLPGDGSKTVWVQFKDAAGNLSLMPSATIQLTTTAPSGGSIVLASGAAATSQRFVPASVSASNATSMQITVSGVGSTGWIPYAAAPTVDLGAYTSAVTRVVTVSFRNAGGVEGGGASTSIRYDQTPPAAGALAVSGTLGNGSTSPALTATPAVVLQITPPGDDETLMAIAQAASTGVACATAFGTPAWQPVSRSATLVLTGSDGPKRACVLFRDAAGNFAVGNASGADITLDATPPTNPSFVNLVSRTQNVALSPTSGLPVITASTDAISPTVTYQCTGGTGTSYGASWVDCGTSTTLPLAYALARNTQSTLGVRARDGAYNYSPGSFVQILHDDVAPFPPFITDLRASRDSVTVSWDASADTDVVSYYVYYGNSATDLAGTGAAQGPSPVQVSAVGGQATGSLNLTNLVAGLPYYVSVEAVDAAGNRSGPGGQRLAVPSKANPRVLSTFAGQPRTMASAILGGRTFLYLAESQGIVQLDVTTDAALPAVVGRAYLPDLVPDAGGTLAVMPCTKGAVTGHCVFPTGSTAEGEYRHDKDNYRAATPVVFFKTTGTGAAPVVGTIEAILPVRPTHVMVGTFGTEKVVVTVDRDSVRAFTFKSGQLAFLKQVAVKSISASALAVYASTLVGSQLYAYIRVDPRDDSAPNLWMFDLTRVLGGVILEHRYGALNDDRDIPIGDIRDPNSVQDFVPAFYGGALLSYVSAASDQTVLSWYYPGVASAQDNWTFASGVGSDGTHPVATAGAAVDGLGNQSSNIYVFTSSGMGSPQVFRLFWDGGLSDEVAYTWGTMGDAVAAYAGFNQANQERLFSIEDTGYNRTLEKYTVSSAAIPAIAHLAYPFAELPPDLFVESDRHLFVAAGKTLFTVDAANPYTPNVVKSTSYAAGWGSSYTKLLVHGRFLYAVGGIYMDIYRIAGDGTLTWVGYTADGAGISSVAVVGRWVFTSSPTTLRAFDASSIASSVSPTQVATLSTGTLINAIDARYDASVAGALGVSPVPTAIIYGATAGGELRTYSFNGAALTWLYTSSWSGDGATSVRVKGDFAVVGTPSGAYQFYVGTPTYHYLSGPAIYPMSGPPLLQNGYVVGLGAVGDASGPVFAGRNSAGVDGAIRFSACAAPGTGASGSLTHVDGRYAAACGANGITLFTPVSVEGGRLAKSYQVSAGWNGSGAALASDGMLARFAGPQVGTDSSRLYTVDERSLAEGTLSAPYFASTNLQTNGPTGVAGADIFRSGSLMVEADGVIFVVTRRLFGTPTVDAYEPVNSGAWTYLGRYTFVGTAEPAAAVTDGEYLYVARNGAAGQVDVVDIRNPASMTLRASAGLFANYTIASLALSRERLYAGLAQGSVELNEVRIWDTSSVQQLGSLTAKATLQLGTEGGITGVAVVGGTLFYTLWDPVYQVPQYETGVVRLGGVDRDGFGAAVLHRLTLSSPAQAPVVAGDVLYQASNLGLASYDLAPFWREGLAPVAVGGVNLADPFTQAPVALRLDGPFATLVGGVYRVFDLR
jgi:hypothetical protein